MDEGSAGFDNSILPWLKRRDIAVLGWETPGYVPQPAGDLPRLAVHDFTLAIPRGTGSPVNPIAIF